MKAGFSEIDISPEYFPIRTYCGKREEIIDPVFVHASVLEQGRTKLAFLSLDVVIVEWEYVKRIREGIFAETGIPEENILVCATHNHACPAVIERPGFEKEPKYIDFMIKKTVNAATEANASLVEVKAGVASGLEKRISFNRRFIKRDGTVVSQPQEIDDLLEREGPEDHELGVLCFKNLEGDIIGLFVNFACHACHGMGSISAGFPGVMNKRLKEFYGENCACLFLNGACGNVIHRDFTNPEYNITADFAGGVLAEDVKVLVDEMNFISDPDLSCREEMLNVKYRDISDLEKWVENPETFVNVFPKLVSLGWYDYSLQKLSELKSESDGVDVVIQVIKIGPVVFAAVPAEYFSEFALKIKKESKADKTFVVTLANGWLGYIPARQAFTRKGGHETSTAVWSKMAPETGDLIANKIIEMINNENG